ncbi:MAG: TIGR04283 family arsenosugar biosynthesis glycosyltransferase [Candidatus Thiodiazotropha lotti]|uniref:TIGR04283 family arsenosugar biosynthesis glycosyltransferase n=1 Tax=Candidatus Thiodiazotropha lotti TaxID=2792787 RepID=A0A9E4K6Y2_9GAMM|nr:TIGR04283 family arsenosugar biosynthesis glycosyltransferase [Candidatus Thiodiazotropha lotti]MCG7922691.1 TIGR04283 family arsenosugar biosynthesis glycosyltransferase [Candidatus Thiodiazotropha lotti]MCG7932658.1 TIGR04283 family arsenosugar biosynthesis glycosyltransferase [Candidatus Thiodiazotropha lotti]MCG7939971.1 TIGR04283 family arsenosugar biosynthesis glycosyltransferase [Candidatus Thiodiazotropha lotti]MCG7988157.1 TIGR04283 family arsenosugar biosynthesis glycosyltransferas
MSAQLSIVIPCLNEGEVLIDLLQTLQYLRQQGHELILVDGGSEPAPDQSLQGWVDHLLVTQPGRAQQMNCGAAVATGELLWFLHADTQLTPGSEKPMLVPPVDASLWGRFDIRLSGSHPLLRVVERMMNWRSRMSGIATGDQGIFVHRALFRRIGGFPQQPLMEDVEISKRLKRHASPRCLHQQLITSSRRWESAGILPTILLMWGLRLAYWLGVSPQRLADYYRNHRH